jgi:2-hydroxychromene-2-carboxylate isomerase
MTPVELFFDCSCVWAYIGIAHFERVVAPHAAPLILRPVNMAELFRHVNRSALEPQAEVRTRYFARDVEEWAYFLDLPLVDPARTPNPSESCMRACVAAGRQGRMRPFAEACFEAAWLNGRELTDPEVIADAWARAGLPAGLLREELAATGAATVLDANTRELMARGGFGVPTFAFGSDLFFGADSVPLLELQVRRRLKGIGQNHHNQGVSACFQEIC